MHFRNMGAAALLVASLAFGGSLHAADAATPEAKVTNTAKTAAKAAEAVKAAGANHKSRGIAVGLAVFPGFAIHGAGHMYAGSWMKGLGLLAVEGAAAYFIADTAINGPTDIENISKAGSGIPIDVSKGYARIGIATVSAMAFLWSWFDDMAGAPVAVAEYNKLQDEAIAGLQIFPREDGAAVALSTAF